MPVLSLDCHLLHNTPHIPSRYNNEQTTKQTKAINNSYTLPAKNMEYFSFQPIFVFCGVCKVFIYLIYIPTHRYYF